MTQYELLNKVKGITPANAKLYADPLTKAMIKFNITSPNRINMFLAQIGHESNSFSVTVENLNYSNEARLLQIFGKHIKQSEAKDFVRNPVKLANRVYANRMGNGSEASGDGYRFRGRGLPQLTGRDNYAAAGKALGLDLLSNPDLLLQPDISALAAAWFWSNAGCNVLADGGKFEAVTRKINGGLNGLDDRLARFEYAKKG